VLERSSGFDTRGEEDEGDILQAAGTRGRTEPTNRGGGK